MSIEKTELKIKKNKYMLIRLKHEYTKKMTNNIEHLVLFKNKNDYICSCYNPAPETCIHNETERYGKNKVDIDNFMTTHHDLNCKNDKLCEENILKEIERYNENESIMYATDYENVKKWRDSNNNSLQDHITEILSVKNISKVNLYYIDSTKLKVNDRLLKAKLKTYLSFQITDKGLEYLKKNNLLTKLYYFHHILQIESCLDEAIQLISKAEPENTIGRWNELKNKTIKTPQCIPMASEPVIDWLCTYEDRLRITAKCKVCTGSIWKGLFTSFHFSGMIALSDFATCSKRVHIVISHHNRIKNSILILKDKSFGFANASVVHIKYTHNKLNIMMIHNGYPDQDTKYKYFSTNQNLTKYITDECVRDMTTLFQQNEEIEVFLIRHGNALHNKPLLARSHKIQKTLDSSLTPLGIKQAQWCCDSIHDVLQKEETCMSLIFHASSLQRSQHTALHMICTLHAKLCMTNTLFYKLTTLCAEFDDIAKKRFDKYRLRDKKKLEKYTMFEQEQINKRK